MSWFKTEQLSRRKTTGTYKVFGKLWPLSQVPKTYIYHHHSSQCLSNKILHKAHPLFTCDTRGVSFQTAHSSVLGVQRFQGTLTSAGESGHCGKRTPTEELMNRPLRQDILKLLWHTMAQNSDCIESTFTAGGSSEELSEGSHPLLLTVCSEIQVYLQILIFPLNSDWSFLVGCAHTHAFNRA